MERVRVIILADGISARELNPFGDKKPSRDVTYTKGDTVIIGTEKEHIYNAQLKNWEDAERVLRTFDVDSTQEALTTFGGKEKLEEGDVKLQSAHVLYEPNKIFDAVVLLNGNIKIIPDKDSFYETFAKKVDRTKITEEIYFGYTNLGEPNFIKKSADFADKSNSISLRDWTPYQLEAMAKFMRENLLCKLMKDGSGIDKL